ncbi:MAG TPA: hypothetical protein VEP89_03890 [Draconibacterium sp.]|nr:hypothetical protein [Draconibacterium sp.]
MKAKVLLGMLLLITTLNWSCIDLVLVNSEDEMVTVENNIVLEESSLKSGGVGKTFSLQLKDKKSVGTMTLGNNSTTLSVMFNGNPEYELREVHLWVGTNPNEVPANKQNKPVPGWFTYKSSGENDYQFEIKQEEIGPGYDLDSGSEIYLFVHANVMNKNTGKEESAWSEGEYLSDNLQLAISYSTYTPIGGGGCFPHLAFCGEMIDGTYYYDITKKIGNIVADNGEVIGTASYLDKEIRFDFDQDWMFSDDTPRVVIRGYNKPGGKAFEVYSGNPLAPSPPMYYYYGPLTKYKYYSIELNVQYCTTDNNYQ